MPGKKISHANMARIQAIADHAHAMGAKAPSPDATPIGKADMSLNDQLAAVARAVFATAVMPMDGYCCIEETFDSSVIIEVCQSGGAETYWQADYSQDASGAITLAARDSWVQVEETWTPVQQGAKAGLLDTEQSATAPYASMKAIGDRLLEVKVAYYGHKSGKDSHNEYFSPNTDFDPENFPAPPLLYYHGFDANGKKMGKPAVTGAFQSRRAGSDGHYLTYKLKNGKYADLQWESAQASKCVVSPGTIGHLIRKDAQSGELLYWPLAEISAWDYAANRAPANLHSVAAPVLKALYTEEGLDPSPLLETAPDPTSETPGDGVSTGDLQAASPPNADRDVMLTIAAEVTAALLPKFQKDTAWTPKK